MKDLINNFLKDYSFQEEERRFLIKKERCDECNTPVHSMERFPYIDITLNILHCEECETEKERATHKY